MNRFKKIAAITAAGIISLQASAFADFSDMPSGAIGDALQNAVTNGLISGYDDGTIRPDENITRAQMATIMVRAMGASETSSDTFNDVDANAWYADSVSKAAAMGAFTGDTDGNFNPENNITFQETYTVVARTLQFVGYKRTYKDGTSDYLGKADDSVLDSFSDKSSVADWAQEYAAAIVGNGGYTGIDGMLKGGDYITRGEFAYLMDQVVGVYVDTPGDYTEGTIDGTKSVIVRSGGVNIDGFTTDRNLIIAYSADTPGVKITNSTVGGVLAVMGCQDTSQVGAATTDNLTSYISIGGTFKDVRICGKYIYLNASAAKISAINGGQYNRVNLGMIGG